ncbi:MAG: nodulation protein NfeD [Cyclobacteriaceae bacterium]|nr:nodulation protein NfeD [Cyclobacteriaceae bacterium]MDX5465770.1 nodulation protein NfeD [Cyclobacteriaceae bacterium]
MDILILSSLLFIGLILLMVEMLFIPGTTIVGILGFLVSLAGVAFAFLKFDYNSALWITAGAAVVNLGAVWYGFSSGVWNKFSLKSSIQGGAFDGRTSGLQVGMKGKAISDIKPFGKVVFEDAVFEVKSEEGFIEVGKNVEIVKIDQNKILVKYYGSI